MYNAYYDDLGFVKLNLKIRYDKPEKQYGVPIRAWLWGKLKMFTSGQSEDSRIDYVNVGDGLIKFQMTAEGLDGIQFETGVIRAASITNVILGFSEDAVINGELGEPLITVTLDSDQNLVFTSALSEIRVPTGHLAAVLKAA